MAVMDATVVDLLNDQAGQIAAANPPSKIALTAIAFFFTVIGIVIGRTVFWGTKAVVFCFLSARYGYRIGMHAAVKPVPAQ